MNITTIIYNFCGDRVTVKKTLEITKETNKCYWVGNHRYLKSEIGKPILRSVDEYPYIKLVMVDSNEEELRDVLSGWFKDKAYRVWRIREEDNNVNEN